MAEEADSGTGHTLLGTHQFQQTVDSLNTSISKLDAAVDKMTGAATKFSGSTGSSTGMWNALSNWTAGGSNNGGQTTFSGVATNNTGGAHRADGPAQMPGGALTQSLMGGAGNFSRYMAATGGNGGGGTIGGSYNAGASGGGVAGGMAAAGMVGAVKIGGNLLNNGASAADMNNDLTLLGTARYMYVGNGGYMPFNNIGAHGSAGNGDYAQALAMAAGQSGYTPDSKQFIGMANMAGGMGIINPTISMSQNMSATLSSQSNSTTNALRAFGIQTFGQSPQAVARQILARTGVNTTGKHYSKDQIAYLIGQNSGFSATLQGMVSSGAITSDFAQQLHDAAYSDLVGQNAGYSASQMAKMAQDANNGDSNARHTLEGIDPMFGKTTAQTLRDKSAQTTKSAVDQVDSFAASLKVTTSLMNALNSAIRKIPFLSSLAGANTGSGGLLGRMGDIGLPYLGSVLPGAAGNMLSGLLKIGGEGDSGAVFSSAGFSGYGGFSESAAVAAALGSAGFASFAGSGSGSANGSTTSGQSSGDVGSTSSSLGSSFGGGAPAGIGSSPSTSAGPGGDAFAGKGTPTQQGIIRTAKKYLGVPYKYGGTNPLTGLDCSSFTQIVYRSCGISLPRTAAQQQVARGGTDVPGLSHAQPGDLLFYGRPAHHVAIYIGGGQLIEEPHTGASCRIMPVGSEGSAPTSIRRFVKGVSVPSHASASGSTSSGSGGGSLTGNRAVVQKVASKYGWGSGAEWNALSNIVSSESSWNNTAQNPHSTAYGLFQFLNGTWGNYDHISKTSDPRLQAIAGMDYIKGRYGDPIRAWGYHRRNGSYEKGAWELKEDETARVHKGEMIIPKSPADQIRQVLLHNNTTNAGKSSSGGIGKIVFGPNSVVIHTTGNVTAATGRAIGAEFAQALAEDSRIQKILRGES